MQPTAGAAVVKFSEGAARRVIGGVIRLSIVKYSVLKSVAHNFSHSFASFMSYVDTSRLL